MMDPFSKSLTGQSPANAFEFDFGFFNHDEDDLLSFTTFNKTQQQPVKDEQNTFASLTDLASEALPDSPESWISNSSNSDNDYDVELNEIISAPVAPAKKQKKMEPVAPSTNFIPQPVINQGFKPAMMDALMRQSMPMPPNLMISPQQLMFLHQQQAMAGFANPMMQTPLFVPVPTPTPVPTKPSSPQVTNARKSSKTTTTPPPTQKAPIASKKRRNSSPPEEEQDENSSQGSSPSSSPTPDSKPVKDKDVKRQRRLIKNRESAQASRERKKVYVQGLEKKVDDLSQTNTVLTNKVLSLEEENILLREQLMNMSATAGVSMIPSSVPQESVEPTLKRRKTNKVLLPSSTVSMVPIAPTANSSTEQNPFANGFWNAFASFSPPQQTSTPNNAATWSGSSRKRVVLFVMLFCVAVFVMYPKQVGEDSSSTQAAQADKDDAPETLRIASRTLLEVESIMQEFLRLNETSEGITGQQEEVMINNIQETLMNKVSFSFDRNAKDVVLRIPVGADVVEKVITADSIEKFVAGVDVKVKKEPGLEAPHESGGGSYEQQMERLSGKMLVEICKSIGVSKE